MPRPPRPFPWRDGFYSDFGGKRTFLATKEQGRREAELALAELVAEARGRAAPRPGRHYRPRAGFKEVVDLFFGSLGPEVAGSTAGNYRHNLRKVAQFLGNREARGVTAVEVVGWRNRLIRDGRYANGTINNLMIAASNVYGWANKAGVLRCANPFAGIPRLEAERRQRTMTPGEFEALLAAADPALAGVLVALRFTSARPGEVRALDWAMVDWGRKLWVMARHKTRRTAKEKGPRVIALPPEVEEVLLRAGPPPARGLVFRTAARGRPWTANGLQRAFQAARERAGLGEVDANGERLVLYSSRHTILTEAARAGVTGPQLQALGGWTSLAMARHYVHLDESDVYNIGMRAAEAVAGRGRQQQQQQ